MLHGEIMIVEIAVGLSCTGRHKQCHRESDAVEIFNQAADIGVIPRFIKEMGVGQQIICGLNLGELRGVGGEVYGEGVGAAEQVEVVVEIRSQRRPVSENNQLIGSAISRIYFGRFLHNLLHAAFDGGKRIVEETGNA